MSDETIFYIYAAGMFSLNIFLYVAGIYICLKAIKKYFPDSGFIGIVASVILGVILREVFIFLIFKYLENGAFAVFSTITFVVLAVSFLIHKAIQRKDKIQKLKEKERRIDERIEDLF